VICLNKRFLWALVIVLLYACIIPASIRMRMGPDGWHWIWNDLAFGFFMVGVFPFAVAVFSCIVNPQLLRKVIRFPSKQFAVLVLYGTMLFLLVFGVISDLNDSHRARQPYMVKDNARMARLAQLHDQAFKSNDASAESKAYHDQANVSKN